ncbi:MAG: NfeD family protein [Planctomycetia bacterium]
MATAFLELGPTAGIASLAVVVCAVPAVLGLAFRWFPETPLGRRVLPPAPEAADLLPDQERRRHVRELVGHAGRTVSELLPWGSVEIDGETVEATSEGGPIGAGEAVEAVGVQGTAVVVRVVEARRQAAPPAETAESAGAEKKVTDADSGGGSALSPTLESLEFDRFDPPAA